MRRGRRQTLKGGDEFDTVSRRARKFIKCFKRAGVAKKIKQRLNRRARKTEVGQSLVAWVEDMNRGGSDMNRGGSVEAWPK